VPYWNWSVDSQAPETSPIFTDAYYGGNYNGCISSGTFSGIQAYYPTPHCVTRQWTDGSIFGALYSTEAVNLVVTSSPDYDTFRIKVEGVLHPPVHNNMGGDMEQMYSTNDPIFWAHHGYVDYMWTEWQKQHGDDFGGAGPDGATVSPQDQFPNLPYKVSDVLNCADLCYSYDDLQSSQLGDSQVPPPDVTAPPSNAKPANTQVIPIPDNDDERFSATDRTNLNVLRYPDPTSDAWLQMNKLDVPTIRSHEADCRNAITKLNGILGYVSPCALYHRPSLCAMIVQTSKAASTFCVDVQGYGRIQIGYTTATNPYQVYSDVKKKAQYCSSNIELPPTAYMSQVESVVGKSAFDGAGTVPTQITNMDQISIAVCKAVGTGAIAVTAAMLAQVFLA